MMSCAGVVHPLGKAAYPLLFEKQQEVRCCNSRARGIEGGGGHAGGKHLKSALFCLELTNGSGYTFTDTNEMIIDNYSGSQYRLFYSA